jgi:serine phosphatase RsbU (regulator of sigma subunit)
MASDRAVQTFGAAIAALWLAAVVLLDVLNPDVSLVALFALAPLVACAVLPAGATAVFAVAAVVLSVAAGWWNEAFTSAQQIVRIVDVVLISGAAVAIAVVRIRRERQHARVVAIAEVAQRAILPILPTALGRVTIGARYLSAAEDAVVGGDLYDCYHSDEHLRFLIGDVRGKGIAAVEQAARVIRAFRQAAATKGTLAEVAEDMSGYLAPFFDDEEFVTALLVDTTDPDRLRLVSCGHPPALLVDREGRGVLLEAPAGLPLGLGSDYDEATVSWQAGERLLMYTDGLSEARDARGQFLPVHQLAPQASRNTVDNALDTLLEAVRGHVPGGQLSDDLAVLLLEHASVDHPHTQARPDFAGNRVSAAGGGAGAGVR